MKIVYFLTNGRSSEEDMIQITRLRAEGHKVYPSNGSLTDGFKDSCDAIVMSGDFPHIAEWAESDGVKVMDVTPKPEPVEEPEPTKPVTKRAPAKKPAK